MKIKQLQAFFAAKLHLVYIDTDGNGDSIQLQRRLNDYARHNQLAGYTVNIRKEAGEKDGIIHFAREINADMIAMITHGRRDLAHLYLGSITADVVNHAQVPVWTCTI